MFKYNVAYVFDVMSREYFIHQIDFFFSHSHHVVTYIECWRREEKKKNDFEIFVQKFQIYMFSCADTHHMFVSLLCMPNEKKKKCAEKLFIL